MAKEPQGLMIAFGHGKPKDDSMESDDDMEEGGDLEEHEYKDEAQDCLDAIKDGDANALAHCLETFIRKCTSREE